MRYIRYILASAMFLATTSAAVAQDDVVYRGEIGAALAANSYLGDFNSSLLKGMQPAGGIVARAIINPYMAVRATAMYGKMKGDVKDAGTVYPDLTEGYSFSNSLFDLSATYEYNFLPYGTGRDYRGAKRLTPFITLGIGATYVKSSEGTLDYSQADPYSTSKSVFTANIPLGVGVKYKIGDRLNLSLDWQVHFTLSDQLDGVKDPYRIKSSGLFKNTDAYSTLMLSLTYGISPRCAVCNKQ